MLGQELNIKLKKTRQMIALQMQNLNDYLHVKAFSNLKNIQSQED